MTFFNSRISGLGSYLPEKELTNYDLEKLVDTSHDWIVERTGISSRHIAAEGECTSDLALHASKQALQRANISPKDLDIILVATTTPDYLMPNTAAQLQHKLEARDCMCFDLVAACSGFVYGLSVADQYIKTGAAKNILVVGSEILHNFVSYKDRETCILFGDGAGAAVISRAEEDQDSKIYSQHMHAEGSLGDLLIVPTGGSVSPHNKDSYANGEHFVHMKGREIFKNAVRTMSRCCKEALESSKLSPEEIDWIVPHQANTRIMEAVARHFGFPIEKVINIIENMGNTSAATIPIALAKAVEDKQIKRGQNLLLTAFGAGLTSGSVLLKY